MSRMEDLNDLKLGGAPVAPAAWPVTAEGKRLMPIRGALEWAFGAEHARLDFDDLGYRDQVSTLWVMIQRGALGCRVDGGGRSLPADDAEIIAGAVAALPEAQGGRFMAVRVAEFAAGCRAPDWMPGAMPRCVPKGWRTTKHGTFAETESAGVESYSYRGRMRKAERSICPVHYRPTWSQIHCARRLWLDWWGALLHLQVELRTVGRLGSIELSDAMPPMTPWSEES